MLARRATLYRIVLPDYVCPDGALARHMLEEGGFEIDEHILATRIEADAFAAQHASAQSLASALAKLYRDNAATLTPDPLHSLVYDSHPPAALRIDHLRRAS
jgi:hypothetical protein